MHELKTLLQAIADPVIREYHYSDDPTRLYRDLIAAMRQLARECLTLLEETSPESTDDPPL